MRDFSEIFSKFILCLLLLYNASPIANGKESFDAKLICPLLVNGTKIKDPRACNTWIECINGAPEYGTCAKGYFYDRLKMACVPQKQTTCISSNPCAATTVNGDVVIDPYSCSGYYVCRNGVGAHGQCPSGMNYNPIAQNCILNYPCVPKIDPHSYCNIIPDGVFIKTNCSGYQLCWQGQLVNGTCPGNFQYNPKTGYCDYPKSLDCLDSGVTLPPNAPNPAQVCLRAGDFLADGLSCNGYYLCRSNNAGKMELVHGICPAGRFFNASNGGACVARTLTNCLYDRCAGLGYSGIQLCNLSNDGCVGFAVCQDGITISTGQCPEHEYFDELKQRCTKLLINYKACLSTGMLLA